VSDWRLHEAGTDRFLVCKPLQAAGLRHAFTLRPRAGTLSAAADGPPATIRARIGLETIPVARPGQVHGAVAARPAGDGATTEPPEADAVVVTEAPGAAAVATADCVGAILCAGAARGFAVVHAGWRGTLAGVLPRAISALSDRSSIPPSRMLLAIGPAIGGCCYEVGEDVAGAFRKAFHPPARRVLFGRRGDRTTLDITVANRLQAEEAGLPSGGIYTAGICTSCRGETCWSYRLSGRDAGRMWAVAGIRR
jgi:YfiH family protein